MDGQAPEPLDPDDVVERELDVFLLNNDLAKLETQLAVLQYPLRPPWRPYDPATAARYKRQARRLELDVPIDTTSENYNLDADKTKRVEQQTLRSQPMAGKGMFLVGRVQGNTLMLVPADHLMQLRPSMQYLDTAQKDKEQNAGAKAEQGGGHESEEEADATDAGDTTVVTGVTAPSTSTLTAVEVQVKRRETERQQQARLNSYAYLHQKEAEEQWSELTWAGEDSHSSQWYWNTLAKAARELKQGGSAAAAAPGAAEAAAGASGAAAAAAPAAVQPKRISRSEYLAAIVPGSASPEASSGLGGQSGRAEAAPAPEVQVEVTAEMKARIGPVLKALFSKHTVCNPANVRQWLRDKCSGPVAMAASLPDKALNSLVLESVPVVWIRRCYVLKATGAAATDPLRQVVVELLADRDSIQKKDIATAAALKGVAMTDGAYSKVVKDMCTSHGNNWSLKPGADF